MSCWAAHREWAAIVPDREPELRDAGVSRFVENGSHPAGAGAAEGKTVHARRNGADTWRLKHQEFPGLSAQIYERPHLFPVRPFSR